MICWEEFVKQRLILGINIVFVLVLVAGSYWLANTWKLEGSNYRASRKVEGGILHNKLVADAKAAAQVIQTRYRFEGEKEKGVQLAAADAEGRVRVARAETQGVKAKNEVTAAQAEIIRALDDASRKAHKSEPKPFPPKSEISSQPQRGFKASSDSPTPVPPGRGFQPSPDVVQGPDSLADLPDGPSQSKRGFKKSK
jgi:hypothetical protein